MTLTIFIAIVTFIIIIALLLSLIWFKNLLFVVIPLTFLVLFFSNIHILDYEGYAIDTKYLKGQEAAVLEVIQGTEWAYLLVKLTKDNEPRLVKIFITDKNKDEINNLDKKTKESLTIIRFGDNPKNGSSGNGNPNQQIDEPDFHILNLDETQSLGK